MPDSDDVNQIGFHSVHNRMVKICQAKAADAGSPCTPADERVCKNQCEVLSEILIEILPVTSALPLVVENALQQINPRFPATL